MASVEHFLARRLKLRVNAAKSAADQPEHRKFLGFSFKIGPMPKRRIAPAALDRFKQRVRDLTRRKRGNSLDTITKDLAPYLIGWRGYFGFSELPSELRSLDKWIRRRLRAIVWKQWKRGRKRYKELRRRGVDHNLAARTAGSGSWSLADGSHSRPASCPAQRFLHRPRPAFPRGSGHIIQSTAVYVTRMHGGGGGGSREAAPYPDRRKRLCRCPGDAWIRGSSPRMTTWGWLIASLAQPTFVPRTALRSRGEGWVRGSAYRDGSGLSSRSGRAWPRSRRRSCGGCLRAGGRARARCILANRARCRPGAESPRPT
jgi:Group II intron, maturase-specific domain